jgi:hypothetical protein
MNNLKDVYVDLDRKCARIIDNVKCGRTVRLTNQFEDGRVVTTFKPKRGQDTNNWRISVRITVYEGTVTATNAKKDHFASLIAAGDAIAAAFARQLNQICAQVA